jgi:hypothetical protein
MSLEDFLGSQLYFGKLWGCRNLSRGLKDINFGRIADIGSAEIISIIVVTSHNISSTDLLHFSQGFSTVAVY